MSHITKRTIVEYIFVAIVAIGSIGFLIITPPQKSRTYDCSLSEISPDYPIEVKEGCRKLRAENFLQKPK